jgi:hypothetical protein
LSFLALETVTVRFRTQEMPAWNQIHIGAYTERSFSKAGMTAYDAALREANPGNGGYEGVFGPLKSYVSLPRMDKARQLSELAVR